MKMAETDRNEDRGWNDPPLTAYTSAISTKPKNKLNQRIAFPPNSNASVTSSGDKIVQSKLPPVGLPSVKINVETKTDDVKLTEPHDIEVVNSRFQSILTRHEDKFNKKTCDEIIKRLQILEQTWRDGKLNDVVQQRIMQLSRGKS
uniref:SRA1/Sec31 domain-containing protein n=1 Tax=Strigamia maritima TaxID=126957 RepID=T1JAV9_STRMM